jgi:hypothetical protein
MYERYVGTPFAWRVSFELVDPVQLPGVHERLAALYEKQGNAAKAATNYQAFIDLLKDADSELQPRVAEARRRLQQLRP